MGIRLVFAIGVTGLLIVFLIPDPLQVLAPQIPVLTPQDWPDSRIYPKLFITDRWPWEEKRRFALNMDLNTDGHTSASIMQALTWYADPSQAVFAWKQLNPESYNGWPIVERNVGTDRPASFLACNPDLSGSPPQCWYLAYWEHWYAEVFFWRQFDEDLLLQEIHELTARVDQLLMSAPDEPCYGFLCTNSNEVRTRNQE
jgi:hypothetical protein